MSTFMFTKKNVNFYVSLSLYRVSPPRTLGAVVTLQA